MLAEPDVSLRPDGVRSGQSFLCGLVGSGIRRSSSTIIHETEAAALGLPLVYRVIDFAPLGLDAGDLPAMVAAAQRLGFNGLNVTHPYKQLVMPLLDDLSAEARAIGAVNTVVFSGGRRVGHNTDGAGFIANFRRVLAGASLRQVVQIGAGGAGSATAYALLAAGCAHIAIHDIDPARAEHLAHGLATQFGNGRAVACRSLAASLEAADGLVQASPVGMAGHAGTPVPTDLLRPDMWVADIVYFPLETALLRAARAIGCRTVGGEGMVVLQAAAAFRLFTGIEPNAERMMRNFSTVE